MVIALGFLLVLTDSWTQSFVKANTVTPSHVQTARGLALRAGRICPKNTDVSPRGKEKYKQMVQVL